MLQQILIRLIHAFSQFKSVGQRQFQAFLGFGAALLPAHRKHRKAVLIGLFSMPVMGGVVAIAGAKNALVDSNIVLGDVVSETLQMQIDDQLVFSTAPLVKEEKVRRTDTVASLLSRMGVKSADLMSFIAKDPTASKLFKPKAGRVVAVKVDLHGDLEWLRYGTSLEESYQESLLIQRDSDGRLSAKIEKLEYDAEVVFKAGRIQSSLFDAADKADLPDAVAVKMAEIFSSDIDFHRELKKGDEFRVVYEQKFFQGQSVGAGRVLAAEFVNGGRSYKAYWFAAPGDKGGYYNQDGESLQKAFLKSPLAFSRVSSGFSLKRFHPIMQDWRAHKGVDYSAPTGTPVRATAHGVVSYIGTQNGYGRVIEVKHHAGYSTAYAHLNGFAGQLRKGSKVSQGDVIGYVGSTGWATGPHLHYEFRINNVQVDPQRVDVAHAVPLDRVSFRKFKEVQAALDRRLDLSAAVVASAR